jgi:hypothetical protein
MPAHPYFLSAPQGARINFSERVGAELFGTATQSTTQDRL